VPVAALFEITRQGPTIQRTAFMPLYGEESKRHTQTCLHFWAISSVPLLTASPGAGAISDFANHVFDTWKV